MLNARMDSDGRVYIADINVGQVNRHSGIGSKLLQALENQLPEDTTIYFTENHAPEFWEKKGFRSYQNETGSIEYRKQSSFT
jgi:N-acetylglutamate synthase-like GNAT family acetyltransferase